MERRDDDGNFVGKSDGKPASRCDDLAGESPVSVRASAPRSRPAAEGEIPTAEAGRQKRASQRELIIRTVIADLNPFLEGWGRDFGTGNASDHFVQVDRYVVDRLHDLHVKRAGRNIDATVADTWTREYFEAFGLYRLRGTVRDPEAAQYRWNESPPASRVREIHGFHGGCMETRSSSGGK